MTWREATIEALRRIALRHHSNFITRTQIIDEELEKIFQNVSSTGKTPAQTLSRVLQGLRNEGYLEFDGHGGYSLLSSDFIPSASDISPEYSVPSRAETTIHRITRDTKLVAYLKKLYLYQCQICTTRLELFPGYYYSEAHHLKPLGTPHNGPDTESNIIVVCPNHHVLLDYCAIKIERKSLLLIKHKIDQAMLEYHNRNILNIVDRFN
jgi:hypothetical protein